LSVALGGAEVAKRYREQQDYPNRSTPKPAFQKGNKKLKQKQFILLHKDSLNVQDDNQRKTELSGN